MTTGRINQVRTIGGARARRALPARVRAPTRARVPQGPASRRAPSRFVGRHAASARSRRLRMPGRVSPRLGGACLRPARGPSCPCGVAPTFARSPAPGLRRPQPRPCPGGFRRPGASPRASEERASGRPGGRAAHAGWPPRALVRQPPACAVLSLGPVQAASDARARLPAPRRSAPQAGLGAELPMRGGPLRRSLASPRPAPPSASARSRRLQTPGRVSPRLGGARLRPGWGPSCPCGVAPSGARSPAPGLRHPRLARPRPRLLVHTFGAPAPPRVKPWRAPRYCQAAYCDSDEGVRPVGHSQRASPGTAAPTERHLQVTRRPPLASRPGPVSTRRRTGARIRTPHGRPPVRAWLRRRAELAPWPPPEALPPCALRADPTRLPHTICSGTMRACENGGPPPLPFSGGEERPPPLPKWEEECTGTADTNPGCNYLVRGYSPSMHYFWRGDMPHFSPPLPFQPRAGARPRRARSGAPACAGLRQSPTPAAGASSTSAGLSGAPAGGGQWWSPDPRSRRAFDLGRPERGASACRAAVVPDPRGRRAVDLGRPEQGARTCQAAAVTQPLRRACRRPWPARHPCRRGPARRSPRGPSAAGRDRHNLKLARRTGRWPAEASAGPRRRRPCPIFTLLLILLTTPS